MWRLLALVTGLAAFAPACGPRASESKPPEAPPVDKDGECKRLIRTIDSEQDGLKQVATNDDPSHPDNLRRLADALDDSAAQLDGVSIVDRELKRLREEVALMWRDLAKVSRRTADAIEANDPDKAMEGANAMSGFPRRETDVFDAVEKHCRASIERRWADGHEEKRRVAICTASPLECWAVLVNQGDASE